MKLETMLNIGALVAAGSIILVIAYFVWRYFKDLSDMRRKTGTAPGGNPPPSPTPTSSATQPQQTSPQNSQAVANPQSTAPFIPVQVIPPPNRSAASGNGGPPPTKTKTKGVWYSAGLAFAAWYILIKLTDLLTPEMSPIVTGVRNLAVLGLALCLFFYMFGDPRKTGTFVKMSPVTLSILGAAIAFALIWVVQSFFEGTRQTIIQVSGGIGIAIGWGLCWVRKNPKDSKTTAEIPDRHLAILEFFEEPIEAIVVTEGNLWLPPGFSYESIDMSRTRIAIPEDLKHEGFRIPTRNGVQMVLHVSYMMKPDEEQLIEVIFKLKPGDAVKMLNDIIVDHLRLISPQFTSDELYENLNNAKDQLLNGIIDPKTKAIKVDPKTGFKFIGLKDRIKEAVKALPIKVEDSTISIFSLNHKNAKTADAIEKRKQFLEQSKALDDRAEKLLKLNKKHDGTMTYEQAVQQASIDMGITTRAIIDSTSSGGGRKPLPVYHVNNPSQGGGGGGGKGGGKKGGGKGNKGGGNASSTSKGVTPIVPLQGQEEDEPEDRSDPDHPDYEP